MNDMKFTLELTAINKSYVQGGVAINVLKEANLKVKHGELAALIGPSGSGKSTLLHIAGLLEKPSSGEIFIDGKNCTRLKDTKKSKLRLHHIGFVYQQYNLLTDFTALENVMMPMLIAGYKQNSSEKRARSLLDKMGLSHRIKHRPAELSGGEQQRVSIARAIANKPKILLGDEPTGNLDPTTSDKVFNAFVELVKEEGLTALIATHNTSLASRMDRKIALIDGKLVNISQKG